MLDNLCLWIGGVVVFGIIPILIVLFTVGLTRLFWNRYGQYFWFKFKHLIPYWWKDETWYTDCLKKIQSGAFPGRQLTRKGQLARLYCPHYPVGTRTMFIHIKK